jgi:hypothetical protein
VSDNSTALKDSVKRPVDRSVRKKQIHPIVPFYWSKGLDLSRKKGDPKDPSFRPVKRNTYLLGFSPEEHLVKQLFPSLLVIQ